MLTEPAETNHGPASATRQAAPTSLIQATPSAYAYPLLIKNLLHSALRSAPGQEIVYRDVLR